MRLDKTKVRFQPSIAPDKVVVTYLRAALFAYSRNLRKTIFSSMVILLCAGLR
jgi:hypothetical protein